MKFNQLDIWFYETLLHSENIAGLAGVNAIEDDAAIDAKTDYYNFQGVRIANPEPGRLIIRRQGTKSEKIIMK